MRSGEVIRVLGPIDLATPDGVMTLGSRNLRALLGALVVSVGHAAPMDRLAVAVWGEDPPPSATGSLHSYVSRLRHVLGTDSIVYEGHSYELVADSDQIDAARFEMLLMEAAELRDDPARCLAVCREALGLWRGEPFGELADEEPFRLEAIRLDELRIAAMELSLEAELALGRQEFVIGELEAAVVEYPYRERLWYLLIEALHRDGRRVDAIRACGRLRSELADVGINDSEELRRLEALILGTDVDPAHRRMGH
jgi:DNA-binding SARP family transcriptional activator